MKTPKVSQSVMTQTVLEPAVSSEESANRQVNERTETTHHETSTAAIDRKPDGSVQDQGVSKEDGGSVAVVDDIETKTSIGHDGVVSSNSPLARMPMVTVLGLAFVVALLLFFASQVIPSGNASEENASADAPPLPVRTVRVGSVAGPAWSQHYAGLLVARQESELSFERAGRVTELHVREGDVVQRGDVLAELDQEDLDASAERAQSELDAAKAVLAELVAGPRRQSIEAAKARVEELTALVELAKIDAQRQQQLAPRGATSRSELDSAVFGLQASENSLLAAKATLEELYEGTRKEKIEAQRAKCAAIEASLREIKAKRSDSTIVAPFAGRISLRMIDEGVVVSDGATVFGLVSDALEAQIGLPPRLAGRLSPGDPVRVGSGHSNRAAWIDRVEPIVRRETRTRVVFLRFHENANDHPPDLFPTMAGEGWVVGEVIEMQTREISIEETDGQHWLPRSALVRGARGLWSVLVIPGEDVAAICQRRSVELLKTDGQYALVQGMIRRDERVISEGLHRVTGGMLVESEFGAHASDTAAASFRFVSDVTGSDATQTESDQ